MKVALPTDPVWISKNGSRPHLHPAGGICTYSRTNLNASHDTICEEIWKKNYLAYTAAYEQRDPIRLHCEELTGKQMINLNVNAISGISYYKMKEIQK